MTVRPILAIGHPTLRTVAETVPIETIAGEEVQQVVADLVETMRAANGAGLAANQIGVSKRIVVIEVGDNPRYPYKPRIPLTVAINPEIEVLDATPVLINEGCLSVPLRGDVERARRIRVGYHDENGMAREEVAFGLTAGTWQHECDHLDGVLITDRADPATLSTWDEFEAHHRDAFIERISTLVDEVG